MRQPVKKGGGGVLDMALLWGGQLSKFKKSARQQQCNQIDKYWNTSIKASNHNWNYLAASKEAGGKTELILETTLNNWNKQKSRLVGKISSLFLPTKNVYPSLGNNCSQ